MDAAEFIRRFGGDSSAFSATGTEPYLQEFLAGVTLTEYVADRTQTVTEFGREQPCYSPALFALCMQELEWEIRAVWNCCSPRDRASVRPLWHSIKEMAAWHLLPLWGRPTRNRLWNLRFAHQALFGSTRPRVVRDLFNRRIRKAVYLRVFAADGNRCVRCGSGTRLVVDHIVPIDKGGLNYGLNFQTLCSSCNAWKNARVWWPEMEKRDG